MSLDLETLKAAIDRMIPADEFPSASEAGVLEFLKRIIAEQGLDDLYDDGLRRLNKAKPFTELSGSEQDELLRSMEGDPFFETLVRQTIEGYYADPGNCGNKDRIAWKMVGFEVTA